MDHVWSILCRSSSIDQETNSVSLFNTLDYVLVHGVPKGKFNLPMDFEVLSMWVRSDSDVPEKGSLQILYIAPDGSEPMKQEMEIDCSNTPFFRSRMKYPGLPLLVPGCYKFQIAFKSAKGKKWSRVATLPLFVEFAPPAESTESQEGAKALPASHD